MKSEQIFPGMDIAYQICVVFMIAVVQRTLLHPMTQAEGEAVMIHAMVRMVLPAERLSEVMTILSPMAERTRAERGCLDCHLYRDAMEEAVLTFEGTWASEADLEQHLRSDEYRQLLLVMELAKVPPEVRFDRVSHSTGLETIQAVRG
jgi:quinol monooxygenase YgiN